jgi:small subunit ribosomal protein S21
LATGADIRASILSERPQQEANAWGLRPPGLAFPLKGDVLQILVRDNNVDQALRVLKKKLQREGVFRDIKRHRHYEKPSERTAREKGEAIRRARKVARKQMIRDGLIAAPKKRAPNATGLGKPRTVQALP